MTEYLAYATTTDSMHGADAGITVFDNQDNAVATETVTDELDGDLNVADQHMLDDDAADALLGRMGYRTTGGWVESGGQWAAEVEPA